MTDANRGSEVAKLFESWMDTANKFWRDVENSREETLKWGDVNLDFGLKDGETDDDKYRTYRSWETSVKNFTTFLKILSAPENQQAMAESSTSFTEALNQAAGDSFENLLEFQGNLIQSFARASEYTNSYNFDNLDHSAFQSFRDLYTSEWQKYLHIPKIGLPREFHEQVSDLVDKSNIFYTYIAELFYLFSLPFEKSNYSIQQKINAMLEQGEVENDPTKLYNEWIKILEGNFMQLMKSQEYTNLLNGLIRSLADYKAVKNDVTNIFLEEYQIPTNKEMDEVYRELYVTKKKVKELTRRLEKLEEKLGS
ncbi:MAG: poly(R)-hydroxyalkanoic acid synthase subunit PhaE [Desulfocapsaceae bacterium]|nr:poly(R)-hydroxyalkanoic acid synthase subunit PhaE [Desulfocapsaceae bacterium]